MILHALLTEGRDGEMFGIFSEAVARDLVGFIAVQYRQEDVDSAWDRMARKVVGLLGVTPPPDQAPSQTVAPDADLFDRFIAHVETVIGDLPSAQAWAKDRFEHWHDTALGLKQQLSRKTAARYIERLKPIADLTERQQRALGRAMRDYDRLKATSPSADE